MKIKILDSTVISQIAAGEVVERPASVVKELLENALDAESTQIAIELKDGGISLIRVTDNGAGIPDPETELAFQRHATSKINSIHDLQHLSSLGFRGEALPSIASVAQTEMLTCARGESTGSFLSLAEGSLVKHIPQARSPGTTVSVYNLFRKIPARLKFLKSTPTESSRVADVVVHYALAYPEVRFTLVSDGKATLRTPGTGKLIDVAMAVYGLETAQNLLEIQTSHAGWSVEKTTASVSGLVGSPKIARASRDYLSFFVNRRWVNNRLLAFAVEEAYHGLLMQGKHPLCILNINISPEQIDVNVHPSKMEIKFQDERSIFSLVKRAVRQTIVQTTPVPQVEEIKSNFQTPAGPITMINPNPDRQNQESPGFRPPEAPQTTPRLALPLLRVMGQAGRNYIVAEGPEGVFVIDQHAAHERILFEKIKSQRAALQVEIQGLLEPVTLELDPPRAVILTTHLRELSDSGFSIESFGESTFLVRSIPAILRDKDWSIMLREVLDSSAPTWSESLIEIMACHSAVRAGQILSEVEMRELVKQLEQTTLPNSCPHGRPTMIQLTFRQLEKEFGRT